MLRLFSFPSVGQVAELDAVRAVNEPVRNAGESIEPDALHEIY